MTVIAWDGKSLAADKRAVASGLISVTTKIRRIGDLLVGIAGNFSAGMEMLEWIEGGRKREDFPAIQRDEDRNCGCLVIEGGRILKYESGPVPLEFDGPIFAMGSGRDFAIAAMHCGKTSKQAVQIASLYENGCGNGVDVLPFNFKPARARRAG